MKIFGIGRDMRHRVEMSVSNHIIGSESMNKRKITPDRIAALILSMIILTMTWPAPAMARGSFSAPHIQWEKAPLGSGKQIRAMTYGNGMYVAISDEVVKTSRDGARWETRPLGVDFRIKYPVTIHSIAYGNSVFVAVGSEGFILTSGDGIKWEMKDTPLGDLYSVIWDGEQFWTVGSRGSMATSTDGRTWTTIPYEEITGEATPYPSGFGDIKYYDSKYYLASGGFESVGRIYQSDDGRNWRIVAENPVDGYQFILYNGEHYVAITGTGYTAYSGDGVHWVNAEAKLPVLSIRDLVWDGNRFVLSTEGYRYGTGLTLYASQDGIEWTVLDQAVLRYAESEEPHALRHLGGFWHDGKRLLAINEKNEIVTSDDGIEWTLSDQPAQLQSVSGHYISYAEGKYYMSSMFRNTPFLFSEDGENWTDLTQSLTEQIGHKFSSMSHVQWTGDFYFARGYAEDQGASLFRSEDGLTWTIAPIVIEGLNAEQLDRFYIRSIEYIGGRFVLIGGYDVLENKPADQIRDIERTVDVIATTDDGVHWTIASQFDNEMIKGMAYGNGRFVLTSVKMKKNGPLSRTSESAAIYTSTDLKAWTVACPLKDGNVSIVHWNGSQFVARGIIERESYFLVSRDGLHWKQYELPESKSGLSFPFPVQLVWTGSYYLGIDDGGSVIYSKDGTRWQELDFPKRLDNVRSLVWDGSKFMTGGDYAVYVGIPSPSVEDKAAALEKAGLLRGGGDGFDLERAPTRAETAVMLVRLMGKETEALARKYSHPFADVPDWASPHIGYLYHHGLTKGVSDTRYGSGQTVDMNMFATLILRLIGYNDAAGDFNYAQASTVAAKLGIKPGQYDDVFLRGHMVDMAYQALFSGIKGGGQRLIDRLLEENAIRPESKALLEALNP